MGVKLGCKSLYFVMFLILFTRYGIIFIKLEFDQSKIINHNIFTLSKRVNFFLLNIVNNNKRKTNV